MWKQIGLGAALLVAAAVPGALHVLGAAPERRAEAAAPPAKVAAGNRFVPTCKAAEVVDTRPDPAWVVASFGDDHCVAPVMPVFLDGYTVSREQIVAGMAAAKTYAVKADAYQQCIGNYVANRKAAADKARQTLDMTLITIENHRIFTSQADKKRAQSQIDVAINAFNEYGSECVD